MGWDSANNWTKKSDAVRDTLADYQRSGYVIHDKASTAQGFYMSVTTPQNVTLIVCFKIETKNGQVWLKSMSEDMGPAMNDCPLKLIELKSDVASKEWASEWRSRVKSFHASKLRNKGIDLIGQNIELYSKKYKVISKLPGRKGYIMSHNETGRSFRLGLSQVSQCKILSEVVGGSKRDDDSSELENLFKGGSK